MPLSLDLFQVNNRGETPLHIAGNAKIAQILLDAGASPFTKDKKGNTPLHWAAYLENLDMVMLLAPLSDLSLVGTFFFLFSQNHAMATQP